MPADLVPTLRRLAREPRFTLAASGTLGIAVAACALVLAFGWATLIQPTALFTDPGRIVDVQATRGEGGRHAVYPADFLAWREEATKEEGAFEAFGAYVPIGEADLTNRPGGGEPIHLVVHRVTADLFPALGVRPERGRTFQPAEETPGRDRVAVLSDHPARRLGVQSGAEVGGELTLDGEPYRVIGVMPTGFGVRGGFPDLWLPLSFGPHRPADRHSATLGIIGRLRPGVSIDRAAAELSAVAAGLEERFPDSNEDLRPSLLPLAPLMRAGLAPTVRLLVAAVLAVLGVAAVNLSDLLLARSIARRGELAVRSSLGAAPGRLARQSVIETVALSLLAALLGVGVAAIALPLLPDLHGRFLYRSIDLRLGAPVLALTAGLALAAGTLAGIAPALRAARAGRADRGGSIGAAGASTSARAGRGRRAAFATDLLVVVQVAVTLALLAGAGLLVRGLSERFSADPGYSTRRVVAFEVAPPVARYPDAASLARFDARMRGDLEALPGVVVAASSDGAADSGWVVKVWPEGRVARRPIGLHLRLVTPGWMEAMKIPVLAGRTVQVQDRADGVPVAVVSRRAAERLWSEPDPSSALGRRVKIEERGALYTIVGVVGDVAPAPGEEPVSTIYISHAQHADLLDGVEQRARLFVVRTENDEGPGADAITRTVARIDPDLPLSGLGPLSERIADLSFRPRLSARVLSAFALLALALAAVGLYSLLADAVARRRREIGIRIALGAGRRQVVSLFARPTAVKIAAGVLAGAGLAIAFIRWLASRIEGVLPVGGVDPSAAITAGAIALAALFVAVTLATATPIRRALRTEPREVLSE